MSQLNSDLLRQNKFLPEKQFTTQISPSLTNAIRFELSGQIVAFIRAPVVSGVLISVGESGYS